jgi:glycosyltransferase involved in cell wall biosynthesis
MTKNIIYFSPLTNIPSGGVKVIHRHSEIINEIGGKSEIYYHLGPDKKVNWFDHKCNIKQDNVFSKDNDFILLPESSIYGIWKQIDQLNIEFGIFVQNGYLLNKGFENENEIWECYEAAKYIVCISEDAVNCIYTFFPNQVRKIIRVTYSVDTDLFKPGAKEKKIAYMPRKMAEHSQFLVTFLRHRLPREWEIVSIDNMPENEVAGILSRTSIFLAFSGLEGLPVPPVEAALSGNFVIGYTGNGGREYWNPPIFESVNSGDITNFLKLIISKVHEIDTLNMEITNRNIDFIKSSFSKNAEISMLKNLIQQIES